MKTTYAPRAHRDMLRTSCGEFMAVDQYGETYHALKHPRKDLLGRLGMQHAEKMYQDTKSGEARHSGYVIAGLWLTVFEVTPWHAKETK